MKKLFAPGSIYGLEGFPGFKQSIPLALQHVVAMVVGCVTPAIMVSNQCGLSPADSVILVQCALIIAGFSTLVQLFRPFGVIGSGLPMIMGVSFAYVPALMSIGAQFGIATILGAELIGGLVAVVFGLFIKKLRFLFPPLVTGTVVFTIGLSLYPIAINYMAGGTGSATYGAPINWVIAVFTLIVVIVVSHYCKGIFKLSSILIGIIAGYILALLLNRVDFSGLKGAGWFAFPSPLHFGMDFKGPAIASMAIMFIVNSVQAIGDYTATTGGAMDRQPTGKEISGGIVGYGVTSVIASLFGGLPTATFSQNVGIVITTKVINRCVLGLAAVIIFIAGVLPKCSALLMTIPQSVLGGATITVFASITMAGMKLITQNGMTSRSMSIVGLAVALGVGCTSVPAALAQLPGWFTSVIGGSSVIIATIIAILLNVILPKTPEDRALDEKARAELEA